MFPFVPRRQNRSYVPLPLIGCSASRAPADRVFQSTALLGTVNTFVKQNDGRFEYTVLFSQCSAVGPAFTHKSLVFGQKQKMAFKSEVDVKRQQLVFE